MPSVLVGFCPLGELGSMETAGAVIVDFPVASDVEKGWGREEMKHSQSSHPLQDITKFSHF